MAIDHFEVKIGDSVVLHPVTVITVENHGFGVQFGDEVTYVGDGLISEHIPAPSKIEVGSRVQFAKWGNNASGMNVATVLAVHRESAWVVWDGYDDAPEVCRVDALVVVE